MSASFDPLDHDRAFHVCIAEMNGNLVLVRMMTDLFDDRHSPISTRLSGHAESSHNWAAALEEHEAIYCALEEGDPLAAQSAMRSHLKASEIRYYMQTADRFHG